MRCFVCLLLLVWSSVRGDDAFPGPYDHRGDGRHGPEKDHAAVRSFFERSQLGVPKTDYPASQYAKEVRVANLSSIILNRNVLRETEFDNDVYVQGRLYTLSNPIDHFSVLPPVGGCKVNNSQTVASTARAGNCVLATNAGFFNTRTKECLGNLVTNKQLVQMPLLQNVNFGIRADGTFTIGYLSETDIQNRENPFVQLVAGVVWLVRNGTSFVSESVDIEDMNTQETGPSFPIISAPRTAIGHNAAGELMILTVEGNRHATVPLGLSLYDMAEIMITFGAVNAINLDGGGSTTMVGPHGLLMNYPTDNCPASATTNCERQVTSVICVHDLPDAPAPVTPPSPPPEQQHGVLSPETLPVLILVCVGLAFLLGMGTTMVIAYCRFRRYRGFQRLVTGGGVPPDTLDNAPSAHSNDDDTRRGPARSARDRPSRDGARGGGGMGRRETTESARRGAESGESDASDVALREVATTP